MVFDIQQVFERILSLGVDEELKEDMISAFDIRHKNFSNTVRFFPQPFTPVSVTGTDCELECKHCASHYLKHMVDASSNNLENIAADLSNRGEQGMLLSGGSRQDGSVPTYEQADMIRSIKEKYNLLLSAHTGILNRQQASELRSYGLDMALVDVIGSEQTIKEVYGLDRTPLHYDWTLAHLSNFNIRLAPHIIVGLQGGELDGEFNALEIVKKYDPEVVVIVVFIPTDGTGYEKSPKPAHNDVIRVITTARQMFQKTPISLSCVRPGGKYRSELDEYALLAGVDRVAVPSRQCYQTAEAIGLDIVEVEKSCCSYGGVQVCP
jgi:uncharacterized radical SAM superfamily protein